MNEQSEKVLTKQLERLSMARSEREKIIDGILASINRINEKPPEVVFNQVSGPLESMTQSAPDFVSLLSSEVNLIVHTNHVLNEIHDRLFELF